ncbi:MAG: hypothetical protein ACRBB0_14245 [Pelagimonas sp.]|uniref:hypothetical protein n=1 Tax=Pelagimonas sp. TaxID=2073170 RepID=UPI003D6A6ADB
MAFSYAVKGLTIAALVFSVSACETLDLTGNDKNYSRVEITPAECQERGGVTVISKQTGEQVCRVQTNTVEGAENAIAGAAGIGAAAASSSAGGAAAAAAAVGVGLVVVLAVANSSSGTR